MTTKAEAIIEYVNAKVAYEIESSRPDSEGYTSHARPEHEALKAAAAKLKVVFD